MSFGYVAEKRKSGGDVRLLQEENGDRIAGHKEKDEVLNTFFPLIFSNKILRHTAQIPEGKSMYWWKEDLVQDYLKNLKVHKSMGLNEIHLQLLRELAELPRHYPSYFKRHSSLVKFLLTRKGEIQPPS